MKGSPRFVLGNQESKLEQNVVKNKGYYFYDILISEITKLGVGTRDL